MLLSAGLMIGGLGLFLMAVTMISDGLRVAAGEALREILQRFTSTPLRGVASGVLFTGVVQSSAAVTIATIGFVNAGLLTLAQSLGVIYGANVGTTMTGWLVAAVGFNLDLEALALPLVGIGVLGRVGGRGRRLGAIGEAVAGFGLFFIGIDVLRRGFESFAFDLDVTALAGEGIAGVLLSVAAGFLMTILTQSSSAAVALILTAVSGGALAMPAAAAMIIGACVGTTSTAVFAAIGSTANARRVAAAHVLFNVSTAVVALLLFPALLWLVTHAGNALSAESGAALGLAMFHSLFSLLGVLIMWPFTERLAAFLGRRFVTRAEELAQPAFLDRTVLVTPVLALEALKHELTRTLGMARDVARDAVMRSERLGGAAREQLEGLRGVLKGIVGFVAELEAERLPPTTADALPELLRITNYLEDVADLVTELDGYRPALGVVSRSSVKDTVNTFRAEVAGQLARCRPDAADFSRQDVLDGLQHLERRWHGVKDQVLTAASRGALPLHPINDALDALRTGLHMAEQLSKATARLEQLAPLTTADG